MSTDFESSVLLISHRAHLNDLENIVPFLGIGLLYSLSGPDLSTAILHFRLFVGARIYHTVAYLTPHCVRDTDIELSSRYFEMKVCSSGGRSELKTENGRD